MTNEAHSNFHVTREYNDPHETGLDGKYLWNVEIEDEIILRLDKVVRNEIAEWLAIHAEQAGHYDDQVPVGYGDGFLIVKISRNHSNVVLMISDSGDDPDPDEIRREIHLSADEARELALAIHPAIAKKNAAEARYIIAMREAREKHAAEMMTYLDSLGADYSRLAGYIETLRDWRFCHEIKKRAAFLKSKPAADNDDAAPGVAA